MHIKIALVQLDVGADKSANLEKAEYYCREAARSGVDIIALPEMFNWMGPFNKTREVAEDENGPTITMLKRIAKEFKCYIVGGSILENRNKRQVSDYPPRRGGVGLLPLNTTFFMGPRGEIICKYSKLHLFDLHIPGQMSYFESKAMVPGKYLSVAKTHFGKVGFAICHDLRYPEVFRKQMMAGCIIIFNSSAFTEKTGKEYWHALNKVRAVENQIYMVSTNQSGHNAEGVKYYGRSLVVDPWGKIVTEGPPDGDVILYTAINLKKVDEIRKQLSTIKKIHKKYILVSF